MSDTQDRRYEDARMDKLETTIEGMRDDIGDIKTKIYNGFSHSIASTEEKVNYIDKRNREEHEKLSTKLDKIFWMFGTAAIAIVIKEVIQGLL